MLSKIIGTTILNSFKLRPSKGIKGTTFNNDITISYNFGFRIRTSNNIFSKNYLSIIIYGVGIGSFKYFKENNGLLTEMEDAVSITYYQAGLIYTKNKVNVGVFLGFDIMLQKQNNWCYQGSSWLSFGVGYKFKYFYKMLSEYSIITFYLTYFFQVLLGVQIYCLSIR